MIESLMTFALGFLAASLFSLLLLPALNARAARLARRRAEALVPLAPQEIMAERDFLRARFAVEQRRLERTVDAVKARRHADMAAIGNRTVEAARLSQELEQRRAEIATGETLRARLSDELDTARTDGAASLATLKALEDAHADLLDGLIGARRERAAAGESAAAAETETLRARLSAAEDALAQALSARRDAVEQENDALRTRIAEVADTLTRRERLPVTGSFPQQATPSVAAARG